GAVRRALPARLRARDAWAAGADVRVRRRSRRGADGVSRVIQAARRAARPLGSALFARSWPLFGELVESQVAAHPELRPEYEAMTDEDARRHFGGGILGGEHLRKGLRYFHSWRGHKLRGLIGSALAGGRPVPRRTTP